MIGKFGNLKTINNQLVYEFFVRSNFTLHQEVFHVLIVLINLMFHVQVEHDFPKNFEFPFNIKFEYIFQLFLYDYLLHMH